MHTQNRLAWARPGHESEYILLINGHGHENYIPMETRDTLAQLLPDHQVLNRGNRVEIIPPDTSKPDHDKVRSSVETMLGETVDLEVNKVNPITASPEVLALRVRIESLRSQRTGNA